MRPIKFRAWDNKHQQMITAFDINGDINHRAWLNDAGYLVHYHQCELMQFTGLLDKNGKEIYEGDVVRHYDDGKPYEVKWSDDSCSFRFGGFTMSMMQDYKKGNVYEVIGNIYSNPDLLTADSQPA